jgi:hypothetical protein
VLFLLAVYNGYKFCPSLLETAGIRFPIRNFRDFPPLAVGFLRKNCPSARYATAANTVCKDVDIFSKYLVMLILK